LSIFAAASVINTRFTDVWWSTLKWIFVDGRRDGGISLFGLVRLVFWQRPNGSLLVSVWCWV